MNQKNTNKLKKRFYFLKDLVTFECWDGWYDIIYGLFKKVEKLIKTLSKKDIDKFRVLEVKEKFGKLRYYTNAVPTEISNSLTQFILEAEIQSGLVCERCGKKGSTVMLDQGLFTVCNRCKNKIEADFI